MMVDELTEVVPVGVTVAETGGHFGRKGMGIEGDQDRKVKSKSISVTGRGGL
jgi:hypothetical protein